MRSPDDQRVQTAMIVTIRMMHSLILSFKTWSQKLQIASLQLEIATSVQPNEDMLIWQWSLASCCINALLRLCSDDLTILPTFNTLGHLLVLVLLGHAKDSGSQKA